MRTLIILLFILTTSVFAADSLTFKMLQANLISGLIPDISDGYGVAMRDFNEDGSVDVYQVCFRNMNRMLVNNGGIIPFIDRTVRSGLGGDLSSRGNTNLELGAASADFNNDGLVDVLIAGWGKTLRLYQNEGQLRFSNVTTTLNLQGLVDANQGIWLDANNDGFLDLYLTDEHHSNRLLLNSKKGVFTESFWTTEFVDTATSQGAASADFDGDGDTDLYVSNWHGPDYLLINDGSGLFKRSHLSLPTLIQKSSSNSAACADIDNNGYTDLLVAGHNGYVYIYKNFSENDSLILVSDTSQAFYHLGQSTYGILLEDFNQDGWIDVFLAIREHRNRLYLNDGSGGFLENYDSDGNDAYSTGCAAADIENDGDLDIFVANKKSLSQVYLNPVNRQNFIKMKLIGIKSNRDAVGTKVYLFNGADSTRKLVGYREVTVNTGYLSSKSPQLYFGTGSDSTLTAEIIFPSGRQLMRKNLKPGQTYYVYEYGSFLRAVYRGYNIITYYALQPIAWLNLFLFIFLILIIYLYVKIGLKRYQWQASEIATQLIIWFVFTLISFIAVKEKSALIILSTITGVSLAGLVISVLYSEQQLHLRKRRSRFRNRAQDLSAKMITLHENELLFSEVKEMILSHEEISRVVVLVASENGKNLITLNNKHLKFDLSSKEKEQILKDSWLLEPQSENLLQLVNQLKVNVLLTVKRENELYALIAFFMQQPASRVNREDLQLLIPLTNQIAIALENNNYIKESARLISELTEAKTREKYVKALEESNEQLDLKNKELNRLFKELQQKEGQLIHSEKMASLGQLVAGISHELNNPISFIYANTKALEKYLEQLQVLWQSLDLKSQPEFQNKFDTIVQDLLDIIKDNLAGSKSVKELVLNLKNFSRLDQADWKEAQISQGIESSLKILKPEISEQIQIEKHLEYDPPILCNPGQLNQVFVNLLSNAIHAIETKGKITITTKQKDEWLLLEIEDTGKGIPDEIRKKIFDPFFTTKDVSKGTGLGLSISYTIIQSHNGKLTVDSTAGKGSTFKIYLPLKQIQNLS